MEAVPQSVREAIFHHLLSSEDGTTKMVTSIGKPYQNTVESLLGELFTISSVEKADQVFEWSLTDTFSATRSDLPLHEAVFVQGKALFDAVWARVAEKAVNRSLRTKYFQESSIFAKRMVGV